MAAAGGQQRYSNLAIETALTLRLVFNLPLCQTEGFLRSVLALIGADLEAPDHTTLSRRSQRLGVRLHRLPVGRPMHLIVDTVAVLSRTGGGVRLWDSGGAITLRNSPHRSRQD